MNIRFMEICGVLEENIEDPIFFNKTIDFFTDPSSNVSQCLYTCLHGSADISLTLGLSELTPKKFPQLESYDWFEGLHKRPNIPSEISLFYRKLDDFRTGIVSDSHQTNADLEKLNSFTMIETSCGAIKDTWVLNSNHCTENMGEKFVSTSPSDWNMGKSTCIGIFQWTDGNRNIAERYDSKDCLDEESRKKMRLAQEFVEEFIQNRKELEELLRKIQTDMDAEVSKAGSEYVETLWHFAELAYRMGNQLTAFHKSLFAPETGLMSKMKCNVIKEDLQDFEKSFCRNFVPSIFDIFSVMTIILVISIVAAWNLFSLLKYELNEEKVGEGQEEIRRENLEKKID